MKKEKIPIKRGRQIEHVRASGRLGAEILRRVAQEIQPGRTTQEVDDAALQFMNEAGCKSAFYGYRGFPGQVCISLNEEVVHGIGGKRRIQPGDIVKIDVGIIHNGWIGDNAVTVIVGEIDAETEKLLWATEESLYAAIEYAREGFRLGDLCASVEHLVQQYGYTVVREFVGHGVGRRLHEEPQVPNYGTPGTGPRLKEGMVLAIEPMVNMGTAGVRMLDDNWTVETLDRRPSAHFEHMVLVGKDAPEILTPRPRRMTRPTGVPEPEPMIEPDPEQLV
ncbi:MAG: type I methionyl aminopeptidase [Verrucomicrobiota bacterium]